MGQEIGRAEGSRAGVQARRVGGLVVGVHGVRGGWMAFWGELLCGMHS